MGRIEYWLLGAVGALIGFIVFEGVSPPSPRPVVVVQQAKETPDEPSRAPPPIPRSATKEAALTPKASNSGDVRSAVRRTTAPKLVRNLADVRRRISEGARGTYMLDMLALQDSVLYRWPDSGAQGIRVWVQNDPKIRNWWVGYVQTVREAFAEWETAGLPIRFEYPTDSANADIVIRWIEQFPSNELRIGKTRRLADHNAWVTHAEIVVALHDREGDSFPPDEVSEILRHEIGHALGLGHSKDRGTIMYPENTQLDITSLDRETLRLLYTLPPGPVK